MTKSKKKQINKFAKMQKRALSSSKIKRSKKKKKKKKKYKKK